ncbi:class I SAM-dependent methyltransferase [Sphingobium fuliginis]|uniref:Methyltransferase domain-containing protein n=1 Tax=Sphingobium fuliginis ATCC 27551 TaxID=1208342 RepID=A0A5B8CIZ4_SPHSA|nr:class I SAM-dependent methyltransferase [Sphingobium fuliginis]QDC38057.1 methyltransferase domain-containing protein [Sphingobium fuliginis ATCC 27551]
MTSSMHALDPLDLQTILSRHLPIYRTKVPFYQAHMLDSIRELWVGPHQHVLDVGGGTGVIAEAIAELFPVARVQTIDMVDRFCKTLSIEKTQYDGRTFPFPDKSFDAATLNNVLHHVPVNERAALLSEIRRVVAGPLYIKDHSSLGRVDDLRLKMLDAIGNIPFGGMIDAQYLSPEQWYDLAGESGWHIGRTATQRRYRKGPLAALFPNRLEIAMRFDPA